MDDFTSFDPRSWAKNGMTFRLTHKRVPTQKRTTKESIKYFFGTASLVAAVALTPQTIGAQPSQVLFKWSSSVTSINGTDDKNSAPDNDYVPTNYWPKLVSVLRNAPVLPDDDHSSDPDLIV